MKEKFDIIIIGAGAFGSSTAYHLSKSIKKVLVIDKYIPPHVFGSSHGQTRIIREAYFEDPIYVPLLRKAYTLWDELERQSDEKLFLKTGGLMLGNKESHVIQGTLKSAITFNIDHEILDQQNILSKFPSFNSDEKTMGVYEHRAGILFPEKCVETALKIARQNGVKLNFNETVTSINKSPNSVEIKTDKGLYKYTGQQLLLINSRNGLSNENVRSIYEDQNHVIWVGTMKGAFQLNNDHNYNL